MILLPALMLAITVTLVPPSHGTSAYVFAVSHQCARTHTMPGNCRLTCYPKCKCRFTCYRKCKCVRARAH